MIGGRHGAAGVDRMAAMLAGFVVAFAVRGTSGCAAEVPAYAPPFGASWPFFGLGMRT